MERSIVVQGHKRVRVGDRQRMTTMSEAISFEFRQNRGKLERYVADKKNFLAWKFLCSKFNIYAQVAKINC